MADVILDTVVAATPARPAVSFRKMLHNPAVVFVSPVWLVQKLFGRGSHETKGVSTTNR